MHLKKTIGFRIRGQSLILREKSLYTLAIPIRESGEAENRVFCYVPELRKPITDVYRWNMEFLLKSTDGDIIKLVSARSRIRNLQRFSDFFIASIHFIFFKADSKSVYQ